MIKALQTLDGNYQPLIGSISISDTIFAIDFDGTNPQQIPIPSEVAGTLVSGTFQAGETVKQAGTNLSAVFLTIRNSNKSLLLGALPSGSSLIGNWVGQTSGAIFTPYAEPQRANWIVFGPIPGADMYAKYVPNSTTAIAAPSANIIDGSAPERIADNRNCSGQLYLSVISKTAGIATFSFYN